MEEFVGFQKIPRLSREIIITEKIDGTNAQVLITDDGEILVGSRKRWITPEQDNFGFAKWAMENKEELLTFGPGRVFGEWWGHGINRGYGLKEKRFSLFNVGKYIDKRPSCCHIVPVLLRGDFTTDNVNIALDLLREHGSFAARGYMQPEGVVIFHTASGHLYKKTLEHDEQPKGAVDDMPKNFNPNESHVTGKGEQLE